MRAAANQHLSVVSPPAPAKAKPYVRAARFVTVELAATIMGLSEEAIRKRLSRGVWLENKQFRRGPDGRVWIDMEGIEAWVLAETA
ncbi:excisionase [Xylophilus sp. GOD-11R]|uniref:excisionase n=1 Tax=Xylophilus sp. GOD-11R TaxID=3089814 RepID=UPI00298D18DD|nr:excisionase [Xylophilus sp. GOD-11R]WPB58598.1 excisionase [Xylophilus sp. GOD-11R]